MSLIVLDAGHGGANPGATYNGRKESEDALALTLAVGSILEENGVDVPNIDLNTGTLNLRAIARNPNGELLSGMYVKVIVPYKSVPKAIVIPEASLGTNQGGRYVYLVGPDDTIVFRQVEVGVLTPDGMREITSGLTLEDRYVTKALINVRPGMKIKPTL